MRPPHTQLNESFRLQFPFVFRQLQSLQLLHSGSPLPSTFAFGFSGPSVPRPVAASLPLSDLRCFRSLSVASVLDSDYSASALPFRLFPVPPRSCFPGAPSPLSLPELSPFSPSRFPVTSFPALVLGLAVRFLSLFPASLPQPFHRCLPSVLTFGIFHFRSTFFRPFFFRF